jgi:hypothetical protein
MSKFLHGPPNFLADNQLATTVLVHYFHYTMGVFIAWLLLAICRIIHLQFLPGVVHGWKHPQESRCHKLISELPCYYY